jgi:hypothetical protein
MSYLSLFVCGMQIAVHSIISWCQFVVKGLQNIEWQHVGFEVLEDGNINLHRPIYRCPGCWAYKDAIRNAVHLSNCMVIIPLLTRHIIYQRR